MDDRNSNNGQELMDWYVEMQACIETLPRDERVAFEAWNKKRPHGVRTSDWPGFERHIGRRPR